MPKALLAPISFGDVLEARGGVELLEQVAELARMTPDNVRGWHFGAFSVWGCTETSVRVAPSGQVEVVPLVSPIPGATADGRRLRDLRFGHGMNVINLGISDYPWDSGPGLTSLRLHLQANLPPVGWGEPPWGWSAPGRISQETTLRKLLPEWYDRIAPGGVLVPTPPLDLTGIAGAWTGLFWPRRYPAMAVQTALATLSAHVFEATSSLPAAQCGLHEHSLLAQIASARWVLDGWPLDVGNCDSEKLFGPFHFQVYPDGRYTIFREPPYKQGSNANNLRGVISICNELFTNAATADYLFWWARRLMAWADRCFDPWLAFMAICCARQALANLVYIASIALHELGHNADRGEGLGHCVSESGNVPRWCCHDGAEHFFMDRMLALYGLPNEQTSTTERGRLGRRTGDNDEWIIDGPKFERAAGAKDCTVPLEYDAQHCGLLRLERRVEITHTVKAPCGGAVPVSSVFVSGEASLCGN